MWAGIGLHFRLELSTKQTLSRRKAESKLELSRFQLRIAAYVDFGYFTDHDEPGLLVVLRVYPKSEIDDVVFCSF